MRVLPDKRLHGVAALLHIGGERLLQGHRPAGEGGVKPPVAGRDGQRFGRARKALSQILRHKGRVAGRTDNGLQPFRLCPAQG